MGFHFFYKQVETNPTVSLLPLRNNFVQVISWIDLLKRDSRSMFVALNVLSRIYTTAKTISLTSSNLKFSKQNPYFFPFIVSVYKEDVIDLCTKCKNCYNPSCQDKFWRSVLILVPVRLGSEALNQIYIPCLQVSLLFHKLVISMTYRRFVWT